MTPEARVGITEVLNRVPFVRWDRFTEDADGEVVVYGWIDRPDAGRSDFVLVSFIVIDGVLSYGMTTSSSAYSESLGRLLFGGAGDAGHLVCQRVESELPYVENAVRLAHEQGGL